jgi:hypothetical protein
MTLQIVLFSLGWILFVLAQAQNSVHSTTNGLAGWKGFARWLQLQALNLVTRAFFSALFFGFIVNSVTSKIQAVGLSVTSTTIAGVAGYAANALLYQIFGLVPWLRVEIPDLEPPSASAATTPVVALTSNKPGGAA